MLNLKHKFQVSSLNLLFKVIAPVVGKNIHCILIVTVMLQIEIKLTRNGINYRLEHLKFHKVAMILNTVSCDGSVVVSFETLIQCCQ